MAAKNSPHTTKKNTANKPITKAAKKKKNSSRLNVNSHKRTAPPKSSMPKAQEKQQTIDEVLRSLNPAQKATVENLRQLVKTQVVEATELIKQGKIVYKLEGKDFAWISHYNHHVDVEFAMGSSLSSTLLKTRGVAELNQNIRHIEADNLRLIKPELERLVREAATLTLENIAYK